MSGWMCFAEPCKQNKEAALRAAFPYAACRSSACIPVSDNLQRWAVFAGQPLPQVWKGLARLLQWVRAPGWAPGPWGSHSAQGPGRMGRVGGISRTLKPEYELEQLWDCS